MRTGCPLLLSCVTLVAGCAGIGKPQSSLDVAARFADPSVAVVAHRGCWATAPENSLAAIETCIEAGVDMVELDVRATADGVLVLLHDDSLNRTTNSSGPIAETSFADLAATRLRIGKGGDAAPLTAERVPTLEQALLRTRGRILVNLDVKVDVHDAAMGVVDRVGVEREVLFKLREAPESQALKTASFLGQSAFMPIIAQCRPESSGGFCVRTLAGVADAYEMYDPVAFELVFADDSFLDDGVSLLREGGEGVWVNTLYPAIAGGRDERAGILNADRHWGSLIDAGVTAIQTDRPLELIRYLGERDDR